VSNWKRHERQVAKALGGKRIIRTDFSQSLPDVQHPLLCIECKYRKKISSFLKDGLTQAQKYAPRKIPVLVVKEKGMRGALVVMKIEDFKKILETKGVKNE